MTVREAVNQAKPKLDAKTFDLRDLYKLLEDVQISAYSEGKDHGLHQGRRQAIDEIAAYLEEKD